MKTLENYILWLSEQNGGYGLGSTPKLAQSFLYGIDNARLHKVDKYATDLHNKYMQKD